MSALRRRRYIMQKKIIINFLSLFLTISLSSYGTMIVPAAEQEDGTDVTEVLTEEEETSVEITEEETAEESFGEETELTEPEEITEDPAEEIIETDEENSEGEEKEEITEEEVPEGSPEEAAEEVEGILEEEAPDEEAGLMAEDREVYFVVGGVEIPAEGSGVFNVETEYLTSGSITFDYETNVLTFDNAQVLAEDVMEPLNMAFITCNMFDELTLRLVGSSSVIFSSVSDYGWEGNGIDVSGLLRITSDDGTGFLNFKASSRSTYYGDVFEVYAIYAGSIEVADCKLAVEGTRYGLYGYYGIEFKAGADVDARTASTENGAAALHTYANEAYKIVHNPIDVDMVGYAGIDDETGTPLNQPEYSYDYYSYDTLGQFKRVTIVPREQEGNIVLSGNCGAEGDNITFELTDEGVLTLTGSGMMKDYISGYDTTNAAPWYDREVIYVSSVIIGEGITHIGNNAFNNCQLLTDVSFPSTLEKIGDSAFAECLMLQRADLPDAVKEIGNYAFGYCRSMTAVTLPQGLESIGSEAFYYCEKLQSIEIPDSVSDFGEYMFYRCSSLSGSVTVPAGVTELRYTFYYCENLEHVDLPEGLQTIGSYTFSNCSSLTELTFPSTVTTISEDAFYNTGLTSIVIPEGVEALGQSSFSHCSDLVSVTLPSTLKRIEHYVFWYCGSLKNINLPEGLEYIGQQAFEECTSLEEIIIPDSVTEMRSDVFRYCRSMTKAVIGNGIQQLPYEAFAACYSLKDLTIGTGVVNLGRSTFENCTALETVIIPDNVINSYNADHEFSGCSNLKSVTLSKNMLGVSSYMFYNCTSLTEIEIPEGVGSIGEGAFLRCTSLEKATIPESITSIGQNAFENCTSLAEVELPETARLDNIPTYAFRNCSALKEITIPDYVKYIGSYAFQYCSSLEAVHYNGVLEEYDYSRYTIGYHAFGNCPSLSHLEFTIALKDANVYESAFYGLAADAVHLYGMPGGLLESNAPSRNYTFHPVGFTVVYYANGGEGEMAEQIIDFTSVDPDADPYCFTENAFTNGDLRFLKWNTKADGSGKSYEDGAEIPVAVPASGTLELYAQWVESYDLWIAGHLIHSGNKDDIEKEMTGYSYSDTPSTYDPETNTLTFNNSFYAENYTGRITGQGQERYYGLYYQGDRELTIILKNRVELTGKNNTGMPDIYGLYCGGSLRLVFERLYSWGSDPSLYVGPGYQSGIDCTAMYVGGNLTLSGQGELDVRGAYAGEAKSIGLRIKGGTIRLQSSASMKLSCQNDGSEAYGLYLEGDTYLRTSNWKGYLNIDGNGTCGSIGGAEGVKLLRRTSEFDFTGYSMSGFYGDAAALNETSYPVSGLAAYKSVRAVPVNHVMNVALAEPDRHYVYTSSAIQPALIVTCNGTELHEGTDYTVKYANNKAAWELPEGVEKDQEGFRELAKKVLQKAPKITVTGKGNFTGSTVLYFEIDKKSIAPDDTSDGTPAVTTTDLTIVSGSKAAPVLYYGTYKLTTKDYTVSPAASTKFKEDAVLTVTGKGNFTGTVEIPLTVVPGKADLKNIAVDFGPKSLVYNGEDRREEILSAIRIYDALDKTEKNDIGEDHYKLTMSGNTREAGTVKVTVTGMNGYSGTKTASIKITANKNIDVKVDNYYPEVNYTGNAIILPLDVYADVDGTDEGGAQYETQLIEGKDYKVTYKNNVAASTASKKATYTVAFIGSYKGKKAITGKFDILPARISNASFQMAPSKVYTKPGAYTSEPVMQYGGRLLKAGTDFTVSYFRSYTYTYNSEAGRYVYEFSGPISSKKGQMITDADFKNGDSERSSVPVYMKITGKGNFKTADPYDMYVASYVVQKEKEPYGSDTVQYIDLSKAVITLTKTNDAGKTVKETSFPYTGNAVEFDVYGNGGTAYPAKLTATFQYDKKTKLTLQYGTDFYISYFNNRDKGTATLYLRPTGSRHYFYDDNGQQIGPICFTGSKKSTFKIIAGKLADLLNRILGRG